MVADKATDNNKTRHHICMTEAVESCMDEARVRYRKSIKLGLGINIH